MFGGNCLSKRQLYAYFSVLNIDHLLLNLNHDAANVTI